MLKVVLYISGQYGVWIGVGGSRKLVSSPTLKHRSIASQAHRLGFETLFESGNAYGVLWTIQASFHKRGDLGTKTPRLPCHYAIQHGERVWGVVGTYAHRFTSASTWGCKASPMRRWFSGIARDSSFWRCILRRVNVLKLACAVALTGDVQACGEERWGFD